LRYLVIEGERVGFPRRRANRAQATEGDGGPPTEAAYEGSFMTEQENDREIALEQIKLARYGLQGTLYGTFAALTAIVIIALAQVITGRNVVEGWAFSVMVIIIAVTVVFYGAFIFDRSLSLESKYFKGRTG
jgi:hypothetical protein